MPFKKLKWVPVVLVVFILGIIYKGHNPVESSYFPKCPFLVTTGYQCPGCGSQRAVHYLLNLEVGQAVNQNLLLVFSIPYILMGLIIDSIERPKDWILKWRRRFFGRNAIFVILVVIVVFGIWRNTSFWPGFG